jgi:serpin B
VRAVQAFGADIYRRLARKPGNVVYSPYSVAVALAMVRNGARGVTAQEIDRVLRAPALGTLNSGLNALQLHLRSRAGSRKRADRSTGTIALDVANSLWGQRSARWAPPFLDALSRDYGTGVRMVDYINDATGAREVINAWAGTQTHGRIPKLLPEGVLDKDTRLVLVNAIYLKAPWNQPFDQAATIRAPFTRADGSQVRVPMMREGLSAGYATGRGWQAVNLHCAGSQLAMAIVVPDRGRLDEVERGLDGTATQRLLGSFADTSVYLHLPRWTFRTRAPLVDILTAAGMPTAFTDRADLSAMTTEERLFIDAVQHEAFVAVDEEGTEATAATAAVAKATSGNLGTVTVTVDRPFLFLIHDIETRTPLFIGRVSDPTA